MGQKRVFQHTKTAEMRLPLVVIASSAANRHTHKNPPKSRGPAAEQRPQRTHPNAVGVVNEAVWNTDDQQKKEKPKKRALAALSCVAWPPNWASDDDRPRLRLFDSASR